MTNLVDQFLPSPHFREKHTITIAAPAPAVWAACRRLDPRDIRLARPLFAARDGIARLRHGHGQRDMPTPGAMTRLAEERHREIVEGLVGQWWKFGVPGGHQVTSAEEFRDFHQPGYAKATLSLLLEEAADGRTRLTTETRVRCLDDSSRRVMARYWLLIRPFSGFVRRLMLAAIRRRALTEAAAAPSPPPPRRLSCPRPTCRRSGPDGSSRWPG
ncbi:hypothetical protein FCH28_24705 [Streptomyces piniterrae]|uniref:DUF2867 domain-containing protein n=1 Tax=Streptomyces piniterrae TaxID=2571125 RepID=A0A4U0N6S8_9ACTN|nr:hypothetical protein [Streptomyces piniterrae]TJZ49507.1 hypothetical protein FCH28_24705 [Streptomyces piniterrae]